MKKIEIDTEGIKAIVAAAIGLVILFWLLDLLVR